MAAGPAAVVAVSMGCTNLLELAVRYVVAVAGIARTRCLDALFAAVLPEADAGEVVVGVAVGVSTA